MARWSVSIQISCSAAGTSDKPGWKVRLESRRINDRRWVATWIRYPDQPPKTDKLVPVEVWEGPLAGEARKLQTLEVPTEALVNTSTAHVHLPPGWLVDHSAGLLGPHQMPVYWHRDARWKPLPVSDDIRDGELIDFDLVIDSGERTLIPRRAQSPHSVWFEEFGWIKPSGAPDVRLQSQDGRTGPDLTAAMWPQPGFRMIPDNSGNQTGFWLLGSLGESVVHVDTDFRRTDPMNLFERARRYASSDRMKRNAGMFSGLGPLKLASVPVVVFGLVAGLLVVAVGRWESRDVVLGRMSTAYIGAVVCFGYWFIEMITTYW